MIIVFGLYTDARKFIGMSGSNDNPARKFRPPFGAIIGTVLGVVVWLVFIILFALEWSKRFDLFQNIVVTVASFLITGLLIAAMWVIWIFSTGRQRYWGSDEYHWSNYNRRDNEILSSGQRTGEVVSAIIILLIIAFFGYHQAANTGFFTSKFGSWEMFALYGSLLFATIPPLGRAVAGARNPVRPLEAASNFFFAFSALYLLSIFPFNFSHFADAFPPGTRFGFFWLTNNIAKLAFILAILGSLISGAVNLAKYAKFAFSRHAGSDVSGFRAPA